MLPEESGVLTFVVKIEDEIGADTTIYNSALIGSLHGGLEPIIVNNTDTLTISVRKPTALSEENEPQRQRIYQTFLPTIIPGTAIQIFFRL